MFCRNDVLFWVCILFSFIIYKSQARFLLLKRGTEERSGQKSRNILLMSTLYSQYPSKVYFTLNIFSWQSVLNINSCATQRSVFGFWFFASFKLFRCAYSFYHFTNWNLFLELGLSFCVPPFGYSIYHSYCSSVGYYSKKLLNRYI